MQFPRVKRVHHLIHDVFTLAPEAADDLSPNEPPVQKSHAEYIPTREEIRAECRRIRQGWSEDERWRRAGHEGGRPHWEVPSYRVSSDLRHG